MAQSSLTRWRTQKIGAVNECRSAPNLYETKGKLLCFLPLFCSLLSSLHRLLFPWSISYALSTRTEKKGDKRNVHKHIRAYNPNAHFPTCLSWQKELERGRHSFNWACHFCLYKITIVSWPFFFFFFPLDLIHSLTAFFSLFYCFPRPRRQCINPTSTKLFLKSSASRASLPCRSYSAARPQALNGRCTISVGSC